MNFEEKLIKLRKKKILSQEELAEKLNVSTQTIQEWELGQAKPDIDNIKEISTLFDISVENLINDELYIESEKAEQKKAKKERKYLLYILVVILIAAIVALIIRINMQKEQNKDENKGIFSIFGGAFDSFSEMQRQQEEKMAEVQRQQQERIEKSRVEQEKNMHNSRFEGRTGTEPTLFVESTLDTIVSTNKKSSEHIVSLEFNGSVTSDEKKIIEIKHSLVDYGEYEVSIEYDDNGYVNRVILQDLN